MNLYNFIYPVIQSPDISEVPVQAITVTDQSVKQLAACNPRVKRVNINACYCLFS